jgi:peptidoglycan hydrolase-like protein with peptidoglycan-binding domain
MQSRSTLNLDGRFGKKTARAVMNLQKSEGLADDGIVGPKTWRALLKRVTRPEMSG